MENEFVATFEYKLIYIFSINDREHEGILKIGDSTVHTDDSVDTLVPNCRALNQAAKQRIDSYTGTAGIGYKLEHTELAIRTIVKDGKQQLVSFRDKLVHNVLTNSGFKKKVFDDAHGKEWFFVDLSTAIKAITAVKQCKVSLSLTETGLSHTPIVFRPEQEDAISRTLRVFKTSNRMLWNAKMRFGKTLSALEVIKRIGFGKTIIITHRPVVDDGWYSDFANIFYDRSDYTYGSKARNISVEYLLASGHKFVYFASMQDLRGSSLVGGNFDKNDAAFSADWDCVIVDEAHEGTTTALGDAVINAIVKKKSKFLALSGTPFNILRSYEQEEIYTWDYVMEQEQKALWNASHFGDSNPYEELPEMRIFTYDLGRLINSAAYVELEDRAFNFREFFRVWTGDYSIDHADMPADAHSGDFVHEADILSFLNLITLDSQDSCYPYSNEIYRQLFKHSLWMIPGVREARALVKLLHKHPVFGSGAFEIVNVAGDGNEEEKYEEALEKVRTAIDEAGEDGYTITLSCGKLTTGVTVPEWTAVFMLSGSFSTSAANYLQTIFRVQSPCNKYGRLKTACYVFDFAPDRTLKMIAEAVAVSTRAGRGKQSDATIMGAFLNYCPVIAIEGTQMLKYDTNRLLQQLKRAYAERAVQTGFDDASLYNDELLMLDGLAMEDFQKLKGIVGASKAQQKTNEIDVNAQGFTDEQYEEIGRIEKKPPQQRTPEEEARLKELKEKRKQKQDAISILRGISIRIPLMVYGLDIDFDEDITMEKLVEQVDATSWAEFMPNGVTKALFKKFIRYYDKEVFVAAARRIRATVKYADTLSPTERVKKLAQLFLCFKNPDKETVLTPWRVVNMHMSDCLGGYDFYDETHKELLDSPRLVEHDQVTAQTVLRHNARILEINSKTGLYPLYVTYSIYRAKCDFFGVDSLSEADTRLLWAETVAENIFVICKTPMAKSITRRTLLGFTDGHANLHYFDDLLNMLREKPQQFAKKVLRPSYWDVTGVSEMRFDAIVGNPPYQLMDGGNGASASPVYQYFIDAAKSLYPQYVSMITPSRWFSGGKGLDDFRASMLSDNRMRLLVDYVDSTVCFKNVLLPGGICYFLWDNGYSGLCTVVSINGDNKVVMERRLDEFDIFVRDNESVQIISRITSSGDKMLEDIVYARNTFGISTDEKGAKTCDESHTLMFACSQNSNQLTTAYIAPSAVQRNADIIPKYKVVIGRCVPRNGENGVDPSVGYRAITTVHVFGPDIVFTDTYLLLAVFDTQEEAVNFAKYMTCKLPRFLLRLTYSSINVTKGNFRFVPFLDYHQEWTDEMLFDRYKFSKVERDQVMSIMRPLEYVIHTRH